MSKIISVMGRFRDDEDGAAMIEYTILLGVITAAVIVTVVWVGGWVNDQWVELRGELEGADED